jgi:acetyltransferase-like isoleucine patch superfamily enzyme
MLLTKSQKLIWRINALIQSARFKHFGRNVFLSPASKIPFKKRVSIGSNCRIGSYCRLEATEKGSQIIIGDNSIMYHFSSIIAYSAKIKIGHHTSLHEFAILSGPGDIEIGAYVRIAARASIFAGNHVIDRVDVPIHRQGMKSIGVTIDDDCWLGTNSVVIDGNHLARGCILGANAVLNISTKPFGIYAGIPAKLLKIRGESKSI